MFFENVKVMHRSFGEGVIVEHVGNYITVNFESASKKFVYPDAFEKFLTLADGTVSEEIINDINASKKAKQLIIDKKNEENRLAMNKGIVIPGKEITAEGEDEEARFKDTEEI